MTAARTLAGFTVGLAALFAAALGAGSALGPDAPEPAAPHVEAVDQSPTGLSITDRGYTLLLDAPQTAAAPLRFRILDPEGAAVTRYEERHEKELHLIVVRRDMIGFQHVHPTLDASGTWSVPVDLTRAGDYRVFADFTPADGEALVLGADLHVAGAYDPQPLPPATQTATVDGYTVTLDGTVLPGQASTVTLAVSRDGRPVTDLQPYLGAYGHLVALRAGDLGYLHVHPEGHPGDGVTAAGPGIDFTVATPSAGDYRLFLDFQHDGVVRTAEFTLKSDNAAASAIEPAPADHGH